MSDPQALAATLSEYDFVVAVDASGSMNTEDTPGRSRWDAVKETAIDFARDVCKIDTDGIGLVIFSGSDVTARDNCDVKAVEQVFESRHPRGGTPLHQGLSAALGLKGSKKLFVLVFTDGVPDDKDAAANVIKTQSNKQQADDECTFLFVQVGNDAGASRYLKMLDDDLKGAKFDIVDTKTVDEANKFASTAELVVNAIND